MAGAPRIINLEDGWDNEIKKNAIDRLEAILNEGLDKKQSKMFSPGEYVQTYTTCYNMCTQVRGMISKTLHFYHHNRR
jgi:cullin 1